jgi:uncharacterized membrane protein YhaH (DUF805 family)
MWKTAFQFYGRERRSVFWSAILMHLGICLIAILVFCSIKTISWIAYLYFIVSIEPTIAITVRRLHDISLSGKRAFLLLIPVVGWLMVFAYTICDSTPADNLYGESLKYLYLKDPISPLSPEDIVESKRKKDPSNESEEVSEEFEDVEESTPEEVQV